MTADTSEPMAFLIFATTPCGSEVSSSMLSPLALPDAVLDASSDPDAAAIPPPPVVCPCELLITPVAPDAGDEVPSPEENVWACEESQPEP